MFILDEFEALKNYLQSGGKILVLLAEGGEVKSDTNLNYFLEEYGVSVNNHSVVRSKFFKYFHPKENLIYNGIFNEEVERIASGRSRNQV
jgi:intraflagellar transport protein 52